MTTKSVAEAAIEHAQNRCPGQDECDIVFSMCVDDFLEGVKFERIRILKEARKNAVQIECEDESVYIWKLEEICGVKDE